MRKSACVERVYPVFPVWTLIFLFEFLWVPFSVLTVPLSGKSVGTNSLIFCTWTCKYYIKTVTEVRWPKLVSPFEYCWKIGIVVRLSFSINNGTDDLVVRKCLLAELTAKIIKHRQSLLLPLTPARKLIFDSFQPCVVVSICSGLWRWSRLPSLLRVLEVSPGSLYFLSSVSSPLFLLRDRGLISGVPDTNMNFISFLSPQDRHFLFFILEKYCTVLNALGN